MSNNIGNIEEIFISRKDKKDNEILELQNRVLKKYIDSRIDEIEDSFKILCDEFEEILSEDGYVLMNRNTYYIYQISSIIPNLIKFKISSSDEEYIFFEEFMANSPNEDDIRNFLKNNDIPIGLGNIDRNSTSNILLSLLKQRCRPKFNNESTKDICELLTVLYKKNSDWFTVSKNSIIFKDKDEVNKYFYDNAEKQEFYFLPKIMNIISEGEKIEADDEFLEKFQEELLNCEYERCNLKKMNLGTLTGVDSGHWDLFDYNEQRKDDCVKIVKIPKDREIHFKDPHENINYDHQVAIDFGTKSTVISYLNEANEVIPVKLSGEDVSVFGKDAYENPTIMHFRDFYNFTKTYESRKGRPNTKWSNLKVAHEAFNELEEGKFESFFIDLKSWCVSNKKNRIKDDRGNVHEFPPFLELFKSKTEPNPVEYYAYFLGLYINNMSETNSIFMNYKMSFPITFKDELRKAIIESFKKGIRKSFPTSILSDENFEDEFFVEEGLREPVAYAITALEKYHFKERVKNGESCCYAVFDFGGGTTDFDFGIYSKIDKNDPDYGIYYNDITRLGDGGVPDLGGEKLLKYLAFEVFKADLNYTIRNREENNEENDCIVPFTTYDGATEEEYSEIRTYVLDDSSSAKKNMSKLMGKLRWIWENPYSQKKSDIELRKSIARGIIDKFGYLDDDNTDNEKIKKLKLLRKIDEEEIDEEGAEEKPINLPLLLRKKIEEGIDEFFNSILAKFKNSNMKQIDEISIFLAGNSTKSILFNIILSEYLGNDYDLPKYYKDIISKNSSDSSDREQDFFTAFELKPTSNDYINNIKRELGNENLKFVVYPPLKTKEAKEKLQSMGYDVDLSKQTEPSGKTGVAYGILAELVNKVRVKEPQINEGLDVAFQYHVGIDIDKVLEIIVIKRGEGCGKGFYEWKKLCPVSSRKRQYMFYYTNSDKALGNNMPIDSKTPNKTIRILKPQDKTFIFIRALEPEVIQWQVADSVEKLQDLDENVNRIQLG